jgi:hypothetical protein
MPELLDYANSRADDILGTLRRLVEIESFSTDKAGNDAVGAYILDRLESIGAVVRAVPQTAVGDHLLSDFGQGES